VVILTAIATVFTFEGLPSQLDMDDPVYTYTPLDPSFNQIRLLNFTRTAGSITCTAGQLIHCSLTIHSLDSEPTYSALSYAWGTDTKRYPLLVDDATLLITANLHAALQRIAEDNLVADVGHLWIDGICINQNDNAEKSSQVQRMQSIYLQAIRVVVWLGPADATSAEAITMLTELGEATWESEAFDLTSPVQGPIFDDPIRLRNALRATEHLFSRSWWTRAWVSQEYTMAKEVVFFCGAGSIVGNVLFTACASLRARSKIEPVTVSDNPAEIDSNKWPVIGRHLDQAIAVLWLRFRREMGKIFTLEDLLSHAVYSRMQATDPKDLVFALLGMARDADELGVKIDYDSSCEEIYTAVAMAYIERGHLQTFGQCTSSGRLQGLPSWTPDFASLTKPPNRWTAHGITSRVLGQIYRTTCHSSVSLSFYTLAHQRVLQIDGLLFDTISSVGSVNTSMVHLERSDEYAIEFVVTTILTTVQEISAFAAQAVKVYGESIFGALWSTLFTDQDVQPRSSSSNPWPSISERQLNAGRTQHFTDTTREYNQFRLSFHEVIEEPDNLLESRFDHLRLQLSAMAGILAGRRAYITSKGYLGLGPGDLQPGDIIVAFLGAEVPTSIRPRDSGMHQMVGETYVHGLMDGEVMDMGLPTSAFHVL
jgi:hypothetical protein